MKILLINPGYSNDAGPDQSDSSFRAALYIPNLFSKGTFCVPLALPTLAGVTPREHTVKIVDEIVDPIDFDEECDLVGITAMTCKATRAYEIAREFKKRGVPVVMGGIHASMCPDEAQQHVDCVVVGEADFLWPKVLEDVEKGSMQSRYEAKEYPDISRIPPPRYDQVKQSKYFSFFLQTTRGCPYSCKFCSVTEFNGKRLRRKTPEQFIKEVDAIVQLRSTPFKVIEKGNAKKRKKFAISLFITDDNFAIDRNHALGICRALKKYQDEKGIFINWFTQANFKAGFDDELLTAMAEAGCYDLFVGFESLNPDTLKSMNKDMNTIDEYAASINNMRHHGLEVYFSVITGGEFDTITVGDDIAEFVEKHDVFYCYPWTLIPLPGTVVHSEMAKAGRILTDRTEFYNGRNVVCKPNHMTPFDHQKVYADLCLRVFDLDKLLERGIKLLKYRKHYYLTFGSRFLAWTFFSFSAILFALQRKITWSSAWKLLRKAPRLVLLDGSLAGLDFFVCSMEFSVFAEGEAKRLPKTPAATLQGRPEIEETEAEETGQCGDLPVVAGQR